MPVELRKRKAPAPDPEPSVAKKAQVTKAAPKVKEAVEDTVTGNSQAKCASNGATKTSKQPQVGNTIDLATFGGEVTSNDGTITTLACLVETSGSGVALFTYPKASTPGCTKQACLFRDSYKQLSAGGLAVYGLSRDSTQSNTTFKEKQKLPYPLLCDSSAKLIGAIGLAKAPKSTQRGVFVVDKKGKILLAEPGSPAGTVEAVRRLVDSGILNGRTTDEQKEDLTEDEEEVG